MAIEKDNNQFPSLRGECIHEHNFVNIFEGKLLMVHTDSAQS